MSDSITRWWPKSQCTMSIASMDEAHAALAARLAEAELKLTRDVADAQRYRWLRTHPEFMGWDEDYLAEYIDRVVDSQMAKTTPVSATGQESVSHD